MVTRSQERRVAAIGEAGIWIDSQMMNHRRIGIVPLNSNRTLFQKLGFRPRNEFLQPLQRAFGIVARFGA